MIKISLSGHSNKFATGSLELSINKKANFIYGKNGTGKTTIADEIQEQLSTDYNVRVFKDFDGVAKNERLDAIALGTKNASIQEKIDAVDVAIKILRAQTEKTDNPSAENLFTQNEAAEKKYCEVKKEIDTFFQASAKQIKELSNPQIAKTNYSKTDFANEIPNATLLLEKDIPEHRKTIKDGVKADVAQIILPDIDLSNYLTSANEILQASVVQPQDIPELKDNNNKQAFARKGMEIHEHNAGEICAFCGNEISTERWDLLANYFNDKFKDLEQSIDSKLKNIKSEFDKVGEIQEINSADYYDKFAPDAKNLNLRLQNKKSEYREFLSKLKNALEEKRTNLFSKMKTLDIDIPQDFTSIKQPHRDLVENHNDFSKNIEKEQEKAKNALRYHEIKKKLEQFNYDNFKKKIDELKTANEQTQKLLNDKNAELQAKQDERKKLILQTKDEGKIAEQINKSLASMGALSFSLELVATDSEEQKGQYQIKGHDGSIRSVTQLSKGEKNIIAFLYFLFSLDNVEQDSKPRIIVLDDPMTSNDDTMQYLMIGEIQNLYSPNNLKDNEHLIILTHNCHFYLNVRTPNVRTPKEKLHEKYGVYHLFSDGKHTSIKPITNGNDDFNTSYATLWKELFFLFGAADATSDIMLSPCRKICETYAKFNNISDFYKNNVSAKKLFRKLQQQVEH